MTQSRYYALFEKWRNMHGYEIRDLYAVLSYIQYLDKCRPCQCAEPQTPLNETGHQEPQASDKGVL